MDSSSCIPDELKINILTRLSRSDLLTLCQVNQEYYRLCHDEGLWKKLYEKDFMDLTKINPSLNWFENYKFRFTIPQNMWNLILKLLKYMTIQKFLGEVVIKYDPRLMHLYPHNVINSMTISQQDYKALISPNPQFKIWDELSWEENWKNISTYYIAVVEHEKSVQRFILVPRFLKQEFDRGIFDNISYYMDAYIKESRLDHKTPYTEHYILSLHLPINQKIPITFYTQTIIFPDNDFILSVTKYYTLIDVETSNILFPLFYKHRDLVTFINTDKNLSPGEKFTYQGKIGQSIVLYYDQKKIYLYLENIIFNKLLNQKLRR